MGGYSYSDEVGPTGSVQVRGLPAPHKLSNQSLKVLGFPVASDIFFILDLMK